MYFHRKLCIFYILVIFSIDGVFVIGNLRLSHWEGGLRVGIRIRIEPAADFARLDQRHIKTMVLNDTVKDTLTFTNHRNLE